MRVSARVATRYRTSGVCIMTDLNKRSIVILTTLHFAMSKDAHGNYFRPDPQNDLTSGLHYDTREEIIERMVRNHRSWRQNRIDDGANENEVGDVESCHQSVLGLHAHTLIEYTAKDFAIEKA